LKKKAETIVLAFLYVKLQKNAVTIVLAFLYAKLKKNARNNDSGIFICKIEKKMLEIIILAFFSIIYIYIVINT
jgi:hypothetical protein